MNNEYPREGVLIRPPLLLGVWIDFEALPDARNKNPALHEELNRGDIIVVPAGSLGARRLCGNDEFGYSYMLRGKMYIGVCPSAINMATEFSIIYRLIAQDKATGTPSAAWEELVEDWGFAIGQNIIYANRDAATGKYTKRCSGLYRYYLWKSNRLMPTACEDNLEQAYMNAFVDWRELIMAASEVEAPQWRFALQSQLKDIAGDRRAVITYILLHELGHHRLKHHANRRLSDGQELEADKFAFERMSFRDVIAVVTCFQYLLALNPKNVLARMRLVNIADTMLTWFTLEQLGRYSVQERRNLMRIIGAPESDGDRPESASHRVIEVHGKFLSAVK